MSLNGVLVVDKPIGPTSHDIVARVRRALGESRIGHTGTLDPAASGVLPLVLGKATRLARFLSASHKSYDAVVRLGFSTDTGDAQGSPQGPEYVGALPAQEAIEAALQAFRGRFFQQPPAYSAKKIGGQRSYKLARAAARATRQSASSAPHPAPEILHPAPGTLHPAPEPPLPAPVEVTVDLLTLLSVEADRVSLRVECSAGFYVRSLAHDLGERLGTGAHLVELRRTRCGDYGLGDAIPLDEVESDRPAAEARLVPFDRMLPQLSFVVLTAAGITRARNGRELGPQDFMAGARSDDTVARRGAFNPDDADGWIRLLTTDGVLLGLASPVAGSPLLHPSIVLI